MIKVQAPYLDKALTLSTAYVGLTHEPMLVHTNKIKWQAWNNTEELGDKDS